MDCKAEDSVDLKHLLNLYRTELQITTKKIEADSQELYNLEEEVVAQHEKLRHVQDEIKEVKAGNCQLNEDSHKIIDNIQEKSQEIRLITEEKERYEKELKQLELICKEQTKKLKSLEKNQENAFRKVKDKVKLFSKNLGLEIFPSKGRGYVVFVFTQICPSDPSKEFMIELNLQHDDSYKLGNSVPYISNTLELEARLNETDDLCGFIVHVRGIFVKMAQL